jgi:hypothetical protein
MERSQFSLTYLFKQFIIPLYTSKEVGCGMKIPNPPLTRNCDREDSVNDDHWVTGKID